jgi:hypothetical protein
VLYSVSRFYGRPSNLPTIRYGDTTNDSLLSSTLSCDTIYNRLSAVLCYVWCHYNRLSALLHPSILHPTIRSTDYRLCSVWRYTATDYPMCSTLSVDSTNDYPIYRLSALICIAILQTTLLCSYPKPVVLDAFAFSGKDDEYWDKLR